VSTADTGDGVVLLDERAGRYWQLNRTGAVVLELLLDGVAVHQIARILADRHPVSTEQAATDITALLERLHAAGLVTDDGRDRP
jgi:hypothetical protein